MTAHDERDVETVAEALHRAHGYHTPLGSYLPIYQTGAHKLARVALDALDVPGRERRAKAEALRTFADTITVQTAARIVEDLRARAAEIDPEEADNGRM